MCAVGRCLSGGARGRNRRVSRVDPEGVLACELQAANYIDFHMKKFLVELDDHTARELERVAPSKLRLRAEFVRRAIRRELDRALDRVTEQAYRAHPMPADVGSADLLGWDPHNALAKKASKKATARPRRRAATKAA